MLKTTILAAMLATSAAAADARGYISKADTMQTPSTGAYHTTKQQETTAHMDPEFTAEDAALIATKITDLLEYNELHAGTAELLHNDNAPHLNAAVDGYVRAKEELETKRRILENELLRINTEGQ